MKNATIKSTRLGLEDNGVFTAYIFLEGHGFGGGFGGYVLGEHAESWVLGVLRCAGVDKWEDLPGKLVRVEDLAFGDQFKRIWHVTADDIYFDADCWSDRATERPEFNRQTLVDLCLRAARDDTEDVNFRVAALKSLGDLAARID